jgi:hypothetical protein
MLVWLLYSALETTLAVCALTLAASRHTARHSIISDRTLRRIAGLSFDIVSYSVNRSIMLVLAKVTSMIGTPQKPSNNRCRLPRSNHRPFKLRMIPWKRGIMPRLYLLAFASNAVGRSNFKIRTGRSKSSAINYAYTASSKKSKDKYMHLIASASTSTTAVKQA